MSLREIFEMQYDYINRLCYQFMNILNFLNEKEKKFLIFLESFEDLILAIIRNALYFLWVKQLLKGQLPIPLVNRQCRRVNNLPHLLGIISISEATLIRLD